jgi:hypothetical protein
LSGNPYLKTEWLEKFLEEDRLRMIERHERNKAFFALIEKDPNYKPEPLVIPIKTETHTITEEEFAELHKHGCGPHDVG